MSSDFLNEKKHHIKANVFENLAKFFDVVRPAYETSLKGLSDLKREQSYYEVF